MTASQEVRRTFATSAVVEERLRTEGRLDDMLRSRS